MAQQGFWVDIAGEYGTTQGSVHLMDGKEEIVMWESAEWVEDPSVLFVIANAIDLGHRAGPDALRTLIEHRT